MNRYKCELINNSINIISKYLVNRLCETYGYSENDVLCILVKTMTYNLLVSKKAMLYAESPEYVFSMVVDELNGDMDSWLKL